MISRAQVLCECVSIYYVSVYVFQETNVFLNKVTIDLLHDDIVPIKGKMFRQTCTGEGLPQYSR